MLFQPYLYIFSSSEGLAWNKLHSIILMRSFCKIWSAMLKIMDSKINLVFWQVDSRDFTYIYFIYSLFITLFFKPVGTNIAPHSTWFPEPLNTSDGRALCTIENSCYRPNRNATEIFYHSALPMQPKSIERLIAPTSNIQRIESKTGTIRDHTFRSSKGL